MTSPPSGAEEQKASGSRIRVGAAELPWGIRIFPAGVMLNQRNSDQRRSDCSEKR